MGVACMYSAVGITIVEKYGWPHPLGYERWDIKSVKISFANGLKKQWTMCNSGEHEYCSGSERKWYSYCNTMLLTTRSVHYRSMNIIINERVSEHIKHKKTLFIRLSPFRMQYPVTCTGHIKGIEWLYTPLHSSIFPSTPYPSLISKVE